MLVTTPLNVLYRIILVEVSTYAWIQIKTYFLSSLFIKCFTKRTIPFTNPLTPTLMSIIDFKQKTNLCNFLISYLNTLLQSESFENTNIIFYHQSHGKQ
jgi:hypothetical protein